MSPKFGDYLRKARQEAGIKTQQQAVQELQKLGRAVSQGLLAQYETGKIKDPDPNLLCLLAALYKKDYLEVIFHLIREKYSQCLDQEAARITEERWRLWEAALQPLKQVDGVPDLEVFQLRAKTSLIQQEVLNAEGLALWEKNYPHLEVVWIVASAALNDKSSRILDSVIHNMKRRVQMVYFVRGEDVKTGGRFWQLQRTLSKVQSAELAKEDFKLPVPVELTADQLGWLNTDLIIANPHWQEHSAGFKYIRRGRVGPSYAVRMSSFELAEMIHVLRSFAGTQLPEEAMEKVLPDKLFNSGSHQPSNPDSPDEIVH